MVSVQDGGCHKKTEYVSDDLVVLAAVNKDAVPQQCKRCN